MGSMNQTDRHHLAEKIIASGDLYRDDCDCGLEDKQDSKAELEGLIDIALDVIAPFGAAGLRDLAYYATELAKEEEFRVEAEQYKRERRAEQEKFSDFDKLSLLIAVNRVDGGQLGYNRAADLVSVGTYTAREICLLNSETLTRLLVGLQK